MRDHRIRLACIVGLMLLPTVAKASHINVSDPIALYAALDTASPGDHIAIAPGHYGHLDWRNRVFSTSVTIAAADPSNPPVFTSLELRDLAGVKFDSVSIVNGPTNAPRTMHTVNILRGSQIELKNVTVVGSDDDNSDNDAHGVNVRESENITILNSEFHDLFRGVSIFDSTNTAVVNNTFEDLSSDGIVGRGDHGVLIADNRIGRFNLASDEDIHPDGIQFWDSGASRQNRDITIRGNIIIRGDGDHAQGIFIKSGVFPTENILIENNVIHQSLTQGIFLTNVDGATIRNNTVAAFDPSVDKPGVEVRNPAANVDVTDNIAVSWRLSGAQSEQGNVTLEFENPWQENYAEVLLLAPFSGSDAAPEDFTALTSAGASDFIGHDPGAPLLVSEMVADNPMMMSFRLLSINPAVADWTFISPSGVSHPGPVGVEAMDKGFDESGVWSVQATMRDGGVIQRDIRIFPDVLLDLTFPGMVADAAPEPWTIDGAPVGIALSTGGGAAVFNGLAASSGGAFMSIDDAAAFSGSHNLEIVLRLRRPAPSTGWERIVSLPGAYDVRIHGDRIRFMVWNEAGQITRADDYVANVSDGLWHDVVIRYQGDSGEATIDIDGVRGATRIGPGGTIAYEKAQTLYLGGAPWNNTFSGELERIQIRR